MQLQISPNKWSCTLTSFAMALNVPSQALAQEIGHDGSEIVFPKVYEPFCRRAFHVQEFILPCLKRGFALVSIEACPLLAAPGLLFHPIHLGEARLLGFLGFYEGVIIGEIKGQMHACAWDKGICYDPAGYCHGLSELSIREFLALIPSQSNLG